MISQRFQYVCAWLVHGFTAMGAVFGVFALKAIMQADYITAFWLMVVCVVIDAVDGMLARAIDVKALIPSFDGALLDNIIDYFNYVVVPAVLLLVGPLLPAGQASLGMALVLLTSCYQFCQSDAKTRDHFFKGFPSYWNIVVFYLFFWHFPVWINFAIIVLLSVLVFVPVKYIYPSRLDFVSQAYWVKAAIFIATLVWGLATMGLLWVYPANNWLFVILSMGYVLFYALFSVYRTVYPVVVAKLDARRRT